MLPFRKRSRLDVRFVPLVQARYVLSKSDFPQTDLNAFGFRPSNIASPLDVSLCVFPISAPPSELVQWLVDLGDTQLEVDIVDFGNRGYR